jgi:hypothetical protein
MHVQPVSPLVLLLVASVTSAGAQGLTLGVAANHDFHYPGDRLELTVSAQNTGGAGVADFYAGIITPDGQTVVTIGPNGQIRLGSLASPAASSPWPRASAWPARSAPRWTRFSPTSGAGPNRSGPTRSFSRPCGRFRRQPHRRR